MKTKKSSFKSIVSLIGLGSIGVVTSVIHTLPLLQELIESIEDFAGISVGMLLMIALAQTLGLLTIAVFVGNYCAPRVGLRSLVSEKMLHQRKIIPELNRTLKLSVFIGLALAVGIVFLDWMFHPWMGEAFHEATQNAPNGIFQLIMGITYGGITEELLLRYGFMSLLVWLGMKLTRSTHQGPSKAVVATAIVLAAVLFGIAHLPAMSTLVELNTMIMIRTVSLNALAGIVFGWLFAKYNLETAMLSHAFVHVGFFILWLASFIV